MANLIRVSRHDRPSWIREIGYRSGYLALFTDRGDALLYGPKGPGVPGIPSWVPGLLTAGILTVAEDGTRKRSAGVAFWKIVRRGRLTGVAYQRIEDADQVAELRRMMTGAESPRTREEI